ncbi:MAG: YceI family protein [Candidatus Thiodiazotropha sp. (ex Epidulcina cf. delphinae)]|nr:YceI family protein [Candidatus Thiodiazotropha sp. (ex Epidulcina cf. delphinae)]
MNRYLALIFIATLIITSPLSAEEYVIDHKGAHAFIQFRIKHLGYSWLFGRFNEFSGSFSYDEKNPSAAKIAVDINPASVDSNHAERDKHLRSEEFLHIDQYPEAKFVSTIYQEKADGSAVLKGEFTLRGVTKPVVIAVEKIGHGKDPWGGYRRGFFGTAEIALKDFAIPFDLGPASRTVQLEFSVEGIRQ